MTLRSSLRIGQFGRNLAVRERIKENMFKLYYITAQLSSDKTWVQLLPEYNIQTRGQWFNTLSFRFLPYVTEL